MKSIYYDFEYYNTSQPTLSVVCCAVLIIEKDKQPEKKAFWLEYSGLPNETAAFKQFIEENKNELFFSYNVIAEAGAMYSLGFDPTKFQWVDIMSEWKQVRNGNHTRLYGKYICPQGKKKVSTPPEPPQYGELVSSKDKKIKGVNNSHTGTGLLSCVYHYTDVDLGYEHKKKMQNRILQGGPFSEKEAKEILDYSVSDVEYLSIVMKKIAIDNCRLARIKPLTYIENAKIRGEWSARLAVMERIGIPVNTTWLYNIAKNHDKIKDKMCSILCATTYPFYEKEKEKGGFKWVMKKTAFEKFLKDNKLESEWPKTDKGNYKTDSETLADFKHFTEILEFRRVKDSLGQIRSFNKLEGLIEVNSYGEDEYVDNPNTEGLDNIFARIGKDKRLRCYFNPYGTQTSRNAPPSRNFIFAMSAWIRSAVQPPPGYAITAIDYSSEEFIIAACESKDKVMEKVYDSGDVYLGFAKIADPKKVPAHATKKSHKEERDMFKATVLGLQFRMGVKKLHRKLQNDLKDKNISIDKAQELFDSHKETFSTFWEYMTEIEEDYSCGTPLKTRDGWYLYCDNPNARSVTNFPMQGAGGAILRRAVKYLQEAGIIVLSGLHDACYTLHKIEDTEATVKQSCELMNQAFRDFYGRDIRMESKTWKHGEYYVEDKGSKYFAELAEYFLTSSEYDTFIENKCIKELM